MDTNKDTLSEVISIVVETLGIEDRAGTLDASTPLFGSMPELDSLAVIEVITRIEDRFGLYVDDGFSGDDFDTIGTLANFVDGLLATT
ncbi:MAG: phosphopantetheine-binding protein [Dermatophilaceae bacterium]